MTRASAGGCTDAPTAAIRPSRTTTVPRSMAGPVPVIILALVIAYTLGALRGRAVPSCARAVGAAISAASATASLWGVDEIAEALLG